MPDGGRLWAGWPKGIFFYLKIKYLVTSQRLYLLKTHRIGTLEAKRQSYLLADGRACDQNRLRVSGVGQAGEAWLESQQSVWLRSAHPLSVPLARTYPGILSLVLVLRR